MDPLLLVSLGAICALFGRKVPLSAVVVVVCGRGNVHPVDITSRCILKPVVGRRARQGGDLTLPGRSDALMGTSLHDQISQGADKLVRCSISAHVMLWSCSASEGHRKVIALLRPSLVGRYSGLLNSRIRMDSSSVSVCVPVCMTGR